jgi:ComF family protein
VQTVVQTFRSAGTAGLKACTTTVDALLSVVLAPSCAACGELLEHPTGGPVCAGCWRSILPLTAPLCDRCGDPLPSWRVISLPLATCPRCRRRPPFVARAAAVGAYDGALRAIVHAIKYEGRRSLAKPLAALMRQRCEAVLDGVDVVVPVPLHPSRRRSRGFNQALDLARHLGPCAVRALDRTRATPSQTGLPAAQRHRNMRQAFAPAWRAPDLTGKIVVLVDDVSTTGATIDACARVLTHMGAREVRAVTAARVVAPPR